MSLIAELKRRNVFRVGVAYAIVAWLLVEMASVVLPALHLPEWTLTLLVFLVVAGFPLALILAWAAIRLNPIIRSFCLMSGSFPYHSRFPSRAPERDFVPSGFARISFRGQRTANSRRC